MTKDSGKKELSVAEEHALYRQWLDLFGDAISVVRRLIDKNPSSTGRDSFPIMMLSGELERVAGWREVMFEIPSIQFPGDWEIRMSPPFAGAAVRFRVRRAKWGEDVKGDVSIYLDTSDVLGCYGAPYWEVYPYDDDTYRCDMAAKDELLEAIGHALDCIEGDPKGVEREKKRQDALELLKKGFPVSEGDASQGDDGAGDTSNQASESSS